MAMICDTGAVYALYDADDVHHAGCTSQIETERGPLLLPVALLSEIDYLLTSRLGVAASLDFFESVEAGSFDLVPLQQADLSRCRELMREYQDLSLGFADASVVVVAEQLKLQRIFTVDHRHFRAIRPRGLDHFVILPADRPAN